MIETIPNEDLDPIMLAHEVDSAWEYARRNDLALASMRSEMRYYARRARVLSTAMNRIRHEAARTLATDETLAREARSAIEWLKAELEDK